MHSPVPEIEIAYHAHTRGVWRPDGKIDAAFAGDFARVRAELVVKPLMIALRE